MSHSVAGHYGSEGLLARIDAGLRAVGKDPERITADDLAAVDQFHVEGKKSTLELAELAKLQRGDNVLDIGGGLGGPARTLAQYFGCSVTVVDLTEEFCRTGEALTARVGLSDQVRFVTGNAMDSHFGPASFDVVWTQHTSMNIADKPAFYRHVFQLLKPNGKLAFHDIMAGPQDTLKYPVPWASSANMSHLESPSRMREHILAAGFRELEWHDRSERTAHWIRGRIEASAKQSNPLGLQLILGDSFKLAFRNMLANLEEDKLRYIQGVFVKE